MLSQLLKLIKLGKLVLHVATMQWADLHCSYMQYQFIQFNQFKQLAVKKYTFIKGSKKECYEKLSIKKKSGIFSLNLLFDDWQNYLNSVMNGGFNETRWRKPSHIFVYIYYKTMLKQYVCTFNINEFDMHCVHKYMYQN